MIRDICAKNHSREVRAAKAGPERDALWKARKRAFGALGRITPSYYTQDGVSRAGNCRKYWRRSKPSAMRTTCALQIFFTRGTVIFIRVFFSMSATTQEKKSNQCKRGDTETVHRRRRIAHRRARHRLGEDELHRIHVLRYRPEMDAYSAERVRS